MNFFRTSRTLVLVAAVFAVVGGVIGIAWSSGDGPFRPAYQSSVFRLRSEVPVGDAGGQRLLEQMMFLSIEMEQLLPLKRSGHPIQVNLFATRNSYDQFLLGQVPAAAGRSAIFVDDPQGGQIYLCYHAGIEQDVRHECAHAVLHQSLRNIPLWLDEGLAEYFEVDPEQRVDGNPYLVELKQELQQGMIPDLATLESLRHVEDLKPEDYRNAWAFVHFFMHGPEQLRREFHNYLIELASGSSVGPLRERLHASMPDMDVLLINHLRTW